MSSLDEFLNIKYKFTKSDENFDSYLKAIGLNFFSRKIAKVLPSTVELVKLNDREYSLNSTIPGQKFQQKFIPGVETENQTIDGRIVRNTFMIEGNKLKEEQIEENRKVTLIKEFFKDKCIGRAEVGDVITIFVNERVE